MSYINYPTVQVDSKNKVFVSFYINNKRYRLYNSNRIGGDFNPNSFPDDKRIEMGNVLAYKIYEHINKGGNLTAFKSSNLICGQLKDIDYITKAYNNKLNENYSLKYKWMFRWVYNMVKNHLNHSPNSIDNIELILDDYKSETSYNTVKRHLNVLLNDAVKLGLKRNPIIDVRKSKNQIDDLIEEIQKRVELNERTLVTTLTKRTAEELSNYLAKIRIKTRYIHSDVETLERVEIMQGLRKGDFDVLIGVNLLREGLDLPEVSLVVILDADKEGFLRSNRSLTQTIGRAARNINGKSILYADRITESMKKTIEATNYRREKQQEYNKINNIVPRQIEKTLDNALAKKVDSEIEKKIKTDEESIYLLPKKRVEEKIRETRKKMEKAAKDLDFMEAARLRDELKKLKKHI